MQQHLVKIEGEAVGTLGARVGAHVGYHALVCALPRGTARVARNATAGCGAAFSHPRCIVFFSLEGGIRADAGSVGEHAAVHFRCVCDVEVPVFRKRHGAEVDIGRTSWTIDKNPVGEEASVPGVLQDVGFSF